MSRGIGKMQHAILDSLRDADRDWLTTGQIATSVDRSAVQVRRAVRALERAGHVFVEHAEIARREDGLPNSGLRIWRADRRRAYLLDQYARMDQVMRDLNR